MISSTDRATGGPAAPGAPAADLDRALDALVENAIRYSAGRLDRDRQRGPDRVEVLDEGPGLEPGEEEAVFERFRRGSAGPQGAGGTGLGLAIARELAREWGGDVTLENRTGGGLEATIMLDPERQGREWSG